MHFRDAGRVSRKCMIDGGGGRQEAVYLLVGEVEAAERVVRVRVVGAAVGDEQPHPRLRAPEVGEQVRRGVAHEPSGSPD
jgi:hypothetical protein